MTSYQIKQELDFFCGLANRYKGKAEDGYDYENFQLYMSQYDHYVEKFTELLQIYLLNL